jgi:hypothetical protein
MKKILILIAFIGFCAVSKAQLIPFKSARSNYLTSNSFTNTAADTLDVYTRKVPASVTVKSTVTRATGTMAGKAYLYYGVEKTSGSVDYVLCDSVTLSNAATNTNYFTKSIAAPYWRIIRNGATTVTGTSAAKISVAQ